MAVGARGLEVVKSVIAFSGALNTIMDVQGVTLEGDLQAFTQQHFPTSDGESWRPNEHHLNKTMEASEPWEGERPELLGVGGKISNIKSLLGTMPAAISGMKYEMGTLYEGIPYRSAKLLDWMDARLALAHVPWFAGIQGFELKRAFCFGLRENLLVEDAQGPRQWSLPARLCFLYLFACVTKTSRLADAAVSLMPSARYERGVGNARHELVAFVSCDPEDLYPCVAAGRSLVHAVALRTDNINVDLVQEVTETCTPEAIMELGSMLQFFEMWRRMDLLFSTNSLCEEGSTASTSSS